MNSPQVGFLIALSQEATSNQQAGTGFVHLKFCDLKLDKFVYFLDGKSNFLAK